MPTNSRKSRKSRKSRSRKLLPKIKEKNMLRDQGYSTSKSDLSRHRALNRAGDIYGDLTVLRHLNLARNYQHDKTSPSYKKMSRDMIYLSKNYKKN